MVHHDKILKNLIIGIFTLSHAESKKNKLINENFFQQILQFDIFSKIFFDDKIMNINQNVKVNKLDTIQFN